MFKIKMIKRQILNSSKYFTISIIEIKKKLLSLLLNELFEDCRIEMIIDKKHTSNSS